MSQSNNIRTAELSSLLKPLVLPEKQALIKEFPSSHHLVVTTNSGVYLWTYQGVQETFRSKSKGIIAARKLSGSGNILAVADSQVIILHDPSKRTHQSYRLKGVDDQVRLLQYNQHSKTLFFTTRLESALQAYSISTRSLLDPTHTHPSPPTVFALSATSDLVLSASTSPPIIHLAFGISDKRPTLLQPDASSAPVVAAAFHPHRASTFVLAFADGILAAYDAIMSHNDGDRGAKSATSNFDRGGITYAEIAHTTLANDWFSPSVNVGGVEPCATAVAFIPGSTCTAVFIGTDGWCRVIDFTSERSTSAEIIQRWLVGSAATTLSILSTGCSSGVKTNLPAYLTAIGGADGAVLLFDRDGEHHGYHDFGTDGSRVIDVEWLEGSGIDDHGEGNETSEQLKIPVGTSGSQPLKAIETRNRRQAVQLQAPSKDPSEPAPSRPAMAAPSIPLRKTRIDDTGSRKVYTMPTKAEKISPNSTTTVRRTRTANSSQDTASLVPNNPSSPHDLPKTVTRGRTPPQIPPRPIGRKGGKDAMQRAEIARITSVTPDEVKILRIHDRLASARLRHGGDSSYSIGTQRCNSMSSLPTGPTMPSQVLPQGPWMNRPSAPVSSPGKESIQSSTLTSMKRSLHCLSSRPISSTGSEVSNDTVIDWRTSYKNPSGSPLKNPTFALPSATHSSKLASQRHISNTSKSSSVESQSISEDSSATNTTIVSWSTRPLPPLPYLPRSPGKMNLLEDPSAPATCTPRRNKTSTRSLAPSSVMRRPSLKASSGKRFSVDGLGLGDGDQGKGKGKGEKKNDVEERLQERVRALEVEMKRLRELVNSLRELVNGEVKVSKPDGKK
ncbi:MAG: hypothetical protein Q9187_000314 [Circinaria calcarea]